MSEVTLLRIGILIAGLILIGAIVFFGRPRKPGQGKRLAREDGGEPRKGESGRREPTLGELIEGDAEVGTGESTRQAELDMFDRTLEGGGAGSELGRRATEEFDKIVTLYLAARAGAKLHGPDIVVAAEKAGRDEAVTACLSAEPRLAPLVGSIAAARATHLEVLT